MLLTAPPKPLSGSTRVGCPRNKQTITAEKRQSRAKPCKFCGGVDVPRREELLDRLHLRTLAHAHQLLHHLKGADAPHKQDVRKWSPENSVTQLSGTGSTANKQESYPTYISHAHGHTKRGSSVQWKRAIPHAYTRTPPAHLPRATPKPFSHYTAPNMRHTVAVHTLPYLSHAS